MRSVPRRVYGLARWLVVLEIGIWRSLFLWAVRRVPGRGPGVEELSYAKEISPVLGAFIFVSAIEVPVVHLLLPWDAVRTAALVIGIWGLLWMFGLLASLRVFRHLMDDRGLRIRQGTSVDIRIPWEAVASVEARRRGVPTNQPVRLTETDAGTVADVPVLRQTRIDVVLREPTTLALPDGAAGVTAVRCYADDPRAFVAAAQRRLGESAAPGTSGLASGLPR